MCLFFRLEHLFRQYVGQNNEITKEDFKKIIQTKNVSSSIVIKKIYVK